MPFKEKPKKSEKPKFMQRFGRRLIIIFLCCCKKEKKKLNMQVTQVIGRRCK